LKKNGRREPRVKRVFPSSRLHAWLGAAGLAKQCSTFRGESVRLRKSGKFGFWRGERGAGWRDATLYVRQDA
jgi:hypothetical protein